MLELRNVNIRLRQRDRQIIENLDLTLNPNDKAAVIGEEGNGKSTLLKLIYNDDMVESYCDWSGHIIRKGRIGYLSQSMDNAFSNQSLSDYFSEYVTGLHHDVFAQLGLPPDAAASDQVIKTLSGGEKVKVQLALILMSQPDILLLDEPTNDIDIDTLKWLEAFIIKSKLPIMFVSHDETLIENTANMIIHLELLVNKTRSRVTVARTGYVDYIASRERSYAKQIEIAHKQHEEYSIKAEKWSRIYNRVDHEQRVISRADPGGGRLLKKKMKSVKSQGKRLEKQYKQLPDIPQTEDAIFVSFTENISVPKSKMILDAAIDNLSIGDKMLAKNIHLSVTGNEHTGIIGKNGIGKSTLLRQIWEMLAERSDITACYMPQDYTEKLDPDISPVEFLARNYSKDDVTRARTHLGSMRFTHDEMTGWIRELSGGQKSKMLFLDMVIKNANVLILDEPTRNFSPLSGPVIRKTLRAFKGTIISVSHDRKYLDEVCDKVYELTCGGLITLRSQR